MLGGSLCPPSFGKKMRQAKSMMQIDRASGGHRRIMMPICFAVLLYGVSFFIIQFNLGYIPVKLAHTYINIPVYYWLVFGALTYLYSIFNRVRFSVLSMEMLVLGIFLQVYIMLLGLNQFLRQMPAFARVYLIYAFAAETALFIISAYLVVRGLFLRGAGDRDAAISRNTYFYIPLAVNIAYQLYRDIKHISLPYFCFHLFVLIIVYVFYKKGVSFCKLNRKKITDFLKREDVVVACIIISAFLIRAFFALRILRLTGDAFPLASDDGQTYDANAVLVMRSIANLARGRQIMPSAYDPGYSIFLGLVYKIFGRNFYAASLIQAALNALMTAGVYFIAKSVFNRRSIGLIAAVLTATNQPLIMLSAVLGVEALYIPLLVFSIYFLVRSAKDSIGMEKRNYYLFIAGLIMGFAIISRVGLLLFPGMVIFWLLLRGKGGHWFKSAGIFILGLAPAFFLVTFLVFANTGELGWFSKKQEVGWGVYSDIVKKGGDKEDPRYIYSNAKLIEMGIEPFKDFQGSVAAISRDPLKVLKIESKIIAARLRFFLFYPNFGLFDPIFILNSTIPNQYAQTMEFYALLFLAAGITGVLIKKDRLRKSSPIIVLILYYLIVHVGLSPVQCARYRVPIVPFLIIFAANSLYLFYNGIVAKSIIMRKPYGN